MKPPFDSAEYRQKLKTSLERIPGVVIPNERLKKRPNFKSKLLYDDMNLDIFVDSMKTYIEDIKSSEIEA